MASVRNRGLEEIARQKEYANKEVEIPKIRRPLMKND
jgi:hypothetical protein